MRPRFSLRLFLIAFTLIAILFGGVTNFIYQVKKQLQRQEVATARLKDWKCWGVWGSEDYSKNDDFYAYCARKWVNQGACRPSKPIHVQSPVTVKRAIEILKVSRDLYALRKITFEVDTLTPQLLDAIATHPLLEEVSLKVDRVESPAIESLPRLRSLTEFAVATPLSDDLAAQLGKMKQLRSLGIDPSRLSTKGMLALETFPQLTMLEWRGKLDQPLPFQRLLRNSRIIELKFTNSQIAETALEPLANAGALEDITFENCQLPQDLSHCLSKAPKLEWIGFESDQPLSANQLAELHKCQSLHSVRVIWPMLTRDDLFAFQLPSQAKSFEFPGELPDVIVEAFLRKSPSCRIQMYSKKIKGPNSRHIRQFKLQDKKLVVDSFVQVF